MPEIVFGAMATHLEWRAAVAVSGVGPTRVQYSDKQMFEPDQLTCYYYRHNGAPWELTHITISGYKLTAKGPSTARGKHTWAPFGDLSNLPEWVKNFIATHKPGGADIDHLVTTDSSSPADS
jgi:hypothetical protein